MTRPALFLDRDGVINVDHGYVYKPEDVEFVNGIFELVAEAKRAGLLVVVITNQAGIGRGYYSENDFHALMNWMKNQFVEQGGQIDAVYFCPYHPEHGVGHYRKDTECRKPNPGMILQAAQDLKLDLDRSFLIGDKSSDIEAGMAAGVGNNFLLSSEPEGLADVPTLLSLFEGIPLLKAI
ncbi:D-glycero-alpha-D-manno-heptose-1,7-bisphosphate 7-phosphatase [Solemya velum gill symbiont]|uniref:D-glycero-alpha-D-manno-heptose-1,7-bisphosphate 7-phosphatase n=1 Tax=Solemya velum gill symbiont TaxID=2340 RepID=UPI000998BE94|nr:HAD family hydrolase [Solemya velum gill symbiont]OOZ44765.1 D,D-heptose 1,7-bisphosphate phosphatase [Solemya velum gill symbiont]OOZ46891.1 D,D-heptose 1,7-bisphosphate phosphatase [Solemya velum gill symbiont]OOZ50594.1 D,D-heptose 1,7-bisphosphate phosphatase [Solemya velum gill symbiont]OOZ51839.1 D,D-heptose 1,7-bisphosphate phosphatase [Solemya velum gill symbiont]OOZ54381.1 D,D-heptose 1,7-bisphosphate phosphatase [Solemya velum gill symbiont]